MRYVIALALPVTVALAAYFFDLPKSLGAHPWWSQKVVLIGLVAGLITAAALEFFAKPPALLISAVLFLCSYAIALLGKNRFAASFAEDALAGQMWYFGWIATCTFAVATLAALMLRRRAP